VKKVYFEGSGVVMVPVNVEISGHLVMDDDANYSDAAIGRLLSGQKLAKADLGDVQKSITAIGEYKFDQENYFDNSSDEAIETAVEDGKIKVLGLKIVDVK
jgi:hypothetical protein